MFSKNLRKYLIKNKTGRSIEAEEIFLDAEAVRSMEENSKLESPIRPLNFIIFYCFIVVCLLALLGRAGYLQVVRGEYYHNLATGNKLRIYPLVAPRGIIYDREQNPLVYNTPSFEVVIDVMDFLDNDSLIQEEILRKINDIVVNASRAELADQDADSTAADSTALVNYSFYSNDWRYYKQKIESALGKKSQLVLVEDISRDATLILESLADQWLGVRLEKNIIRQYTGGAYFSHILGYTGRVDTDDLKNYPDYFSNDQIGKMGLELQYENLLRGVFGQRQVEVNSTGKKQSLLATKPAQPGKSLILHIDRDLQLKIHQSLEAMLKKLKLKKAIGLAIDPRNGGVLALVSLPSFNNNLFSKGISKGELTALENDPSQPFLNRAISGQYPSGSTIKPLIGAAALQEKVVKSYQQINCPGIVNIVNKYDPEIVYNFPDWKAHGLTDIIEAIAQSCNVYFYAVGGGYEKIKGLGIDRIKEYLQYFGLGQFTDIDLPSEAAGLIPDGEWKFARDGEEWNLGDTYHVAIGQGDILVTPLQMTSAIVGIANGGTVYRAQLADKIIDLENRQVEDISPVIAKENFISQENLEIIRKGMRQAVVSGSGRALADLPVKAAGKTGTAQFGVDQMHAWFVSFAPYQEPEIVLTILIEGGGEGHQAAVPVAKEILEWYFSK